MYYSNKEWILNKDDPEHVTHLNVSKGTINSLMHGDYLHIHQVENATDNELMRNCAYLGDSKLRNLRIAVAEFRGEDVEKIKEFYREPDLTAKDCLDVACARLRRALEYNHKQEIAKAMANLYLRMGDYVDAGFISNEAIESELIKEEK